jgi:hypothetical protein
MIDDGYTYPYVNGIQYRSLGPPGRALVRGLRDDLTVLEGFLWQPPRLFGATSDDLSDGDKCNLFDLMMNADTEDYDLKNLKSGVELFLQHPMLGLRSCQLCRKYWYDEDSYTVVTDHDGRPKTRPEHAPVACETGTGCLKGHHSDPIELSEKNKQAWRHYLNWRHVGLPDIDKQCPVLRKNWEIMGTLVERHGLPRPRKQQTVRDQH